MVLYRPSDAFAVDISRCRPPLVNSLLNVCPKPVQRQLVSYPSRGLRPTSCRQLHPYREDAEPCLPTLRSRATTGRCPAALASFTLMLGFFSIISVGTSRFISPSKQSDKLIVSIHPCSSRRIFLVPGHPIPLGVFFHSV